MKEFVDGKKTDGSIKIIDWENVENNIYHVTTEYNIIDKKNIRIDIVVFINGIPCAIIENKKPSVAVDEAIYQSSFFVSHIFYLIYFYQKHFHHLASA